MDRALNIWGQKKPSMEGRRHIVQMYIGGMTQYLTKVQGMPKTVEKRLEKRVRTFMWGDKTQAPVNRETLHAPIALGGRAVLQIDSERPLWGLFADAILAKNIPKSERNVPINLRINTFLQTAKKFGVRQEGLAFSRSILRSMPQHCKAQYCR